MYGFDHDSDENHPAATPSGLGDVLVLIVPAAIMLAGFAIAVFVL